MDERVEMGFEMTSGSKEIVRLASEQRLTNWHGATGWMVTASVVGGVCEIHISYAGKKMKWFGPIAGAALGSEMSGMTGTMYVEPEELMKHKVVTISSSKIGVGFTRLEFWLGEGGVGFAGNLIGVGIGLGMTNAIGYGEWVYE